MMTVRSASAHLLQDDSSQFLEEVSVSLSLRAVLSLPSTLTAMWHTPSSLSYSVQFHYSYPQTPVHWGLSSLVKANRPTNARTVVLWLNSFISDQDIRLPSISQSGLETKHRKQKQPTTNSVLNQGLRLIAINPFVAINNTELSAPTNCRGFSGYWSPNRGLQHFSLSVAS